MSGEWQSGVIPNEANVEKQLGTNNVRISFTSEEHGTIRVILDQTQLLWLIGALHEKIERSPLTPISLDRLRPGKDIWIRGTTIQDAIDGLPPYDNRRFALSAGIRLNRRTLPDMLKKAPPHPPRSSRA